MAANDSRRVGWGISILGVSTAGLLLSTVLVLAQSDFRDQPYWKGQQAFKDKGCALCHSNGGTDGKKSAPNLTERHFFGTYLALASGMWNHFPKMYERMQETDFEFPEMSEQEMGQIMTYLSYARYRGKPGIEHRGRRLLEKSCMKCHVFGESGRDIGPNFVSNRKYLSSIQLVTAMWNHGPDMMPTFEEYDIKRPEFKRDDVEDLLAAIRAYMPTSIIPASEYDMGDAASGEVLVEQKGCKKCHAVRGVGANVGPDFAELDLDCSAAQIAGRMWNHGPKMWEAMQREKVQIPRFENDEMVDVVAYLYALHLEDEPGDPLKGRQLLKDKHCLDCHALRGEGGTIAEDLAPLGRANTPLAMLAAMWNHGPAMREEQVERGVKWTKLGARDMADLYACLRESAQAPDRGR